MNAIVSFTPIPMEDGVQRTLQLSTLSAVDFAVEVLAGTRTGPIFETLVVTEAMKWVSTSGLAADLFFYRTRSGMEVDLSLSTPGGLLVASRVLRCRRRQRVALRV